MLIEVFKSGTHSDSKGRNLHYSDKAIDEIVNCYNSKISQDISFIAPIVKGHPQDDAPAYGWVEYLVKKGKTILAKIKNIDPDFAQELKTGKYKKVSVALYPDNMLKHIGFLGAVSPAVKGLKPVEYSEDNEQNNTLNIDFDYDSYSEPNNDSEIIEKKVKALEDKIKYYEQVLQEMTQDKRITEYREYCNSFISKNGKKGIKPVYVKYLTDILEMAHTLDNQFNVNQNSVIVREFIEQLVDTIDTSEFTATDNVQNELNNSFDGKNVIESRMQLHKRALEIMNKDPKITYNSAITMALK
jgi:hypothetical protein